MISATILGEELNSFLGPWTAGIQLIQGSTDSQFCDSFHSSVQGIAKGRWKSKLEAQTFLYLPVVTQRKDTLGKVQNLWHTVNILSIFSIRQYSTSAHFHCSSHFLSVTNVYAYTCMFWFATSFNSSVLRETLIFISEHCKAFFFLQCLLSDSRRTLTCERTYSKSIAFPSF